uniref:Uncharacterized protein n=1 Tax=Tanacetum cinerariifolium TaxID=118510 RepID=A0A699IUK4_TANCI|nr:hypothetical protein [Tanacetum cinerariifolium]
MATTIEQQVVLDEALVPTTQRLRIGRSNFRLPSDIQSKESTLQLVYDVLRRCPFFKAFLVTADVPEVYMQELWATAYVHQHSIRFKMNNKKHIVDLESFRETLHISPRIPGQAFDEVPFEQEILEFIRFLGHGATIRTLTDININKIYQPWRSFAVIINKCPTGKSSGFDSLRLSQAQILWGLYHTRSIDYAFLIWEDFVYQVEHKNQKKSNEMYYPRFIKVIIHHFMSKNPSIPRRNKINSHYVRDDSIFLMIKVVSRHQNTQQYGAMLPIELTDDEIRNSKAYKEYYALATGEAVPKLKASARSKRSGSDTSITPPTTITTPTTTIFVTPRLTVAAKGKQPAKAKSAQEKEGDDDEGDMRDESDDGEEDDVTKDDDDDRDIADDNQEAEQMDKQDDAGGGEDDDESEEEDDEDEETKSDKESDDEETKEEESFDPIPRTPEDSEDDGNGEEDQGLRISKKERLNEEEEAEEIYRDVNINQGREIQPNLDVEDSHVTLTLIHSDGQQESSSVSSQFVTSMLNQISDASMESIFVTASSPTEVIGSFSEFSQTNPFVEAVFAIPGIVHQYMKRKMTEAVRVAVQLQTDKLRDASQRENDEFLCTIVENIKKIIKEQVKSQVKDQVSRILPRIEQSVNAQLEAEVLTSSSHSSRTLYVVAADLSEMELKKIFIEKIEGNKRREGTEPESASAPLEPVTESAGRSRTGSRSRQASASESAYAEEPVQTTSQIEEPSHLLFETDSDWNKTLPAIQGSTQTWISELAKQVDSRSSFNELLDTPLDFFNFIMNRLRVDTLTPELLVGPTFDLMKGSCTSMIELEYHLEEIYKATTNQLDWVNPEGQQYPHNLLQPLSLIPNNRGRHVIPFAHFINNDLEYLRGEEVYKATTDQLDWVNPEGQQYPHNLLQPLPLIPDNQGRRVIPFDHFINNDLEYLRGAQPIDYNRHALWGASHWGRKRQQFYGYTVNRESALDVCSKRRIIAVTELKIVEWHDYKNLDWISGRKLSNLTVEERFAFNVSLRMFTRSIVIQRHVEDLQLGVESYQKRLNLTKPDTYRTDLRRREAYTAYSNPRGFIYQNKDKKNRLMRIDKLHKFNDGTLNDVRNALDDHLKG